MPFAGQGFIEPSACDEPEKILLEFSREIFMEQLQFHKDPSDPNSPGNFIKHFVRLADWSGSRT